MTMTASRFLHAAERMESAAQALYADLAVAFTEHPQLRQLFQRLAAEEEQHAMRIRLLQRHQGKAPWPPEILDRFCGECDALVAEIEKIRTELGRSPASDDARATLRRLAELEDRFCSIHAQDLARYAAPEVEKLFATLALQDSAHRDLVAAAMLTEVA